MEPVLETIKQQVSEALGTLSLISAPEDEDDALMLRHAKAQLAGTAHGIDNILKHACDGLEHTHER